MQTVRKYMVYEYVPFMEQTFRNGTGQSCFAQRSIYIILKGNEDTRSYIIKVRNVLRHLLYCQHVSFYYNTRYSILAFLPFYDIYIYTCKFKLTHKTLIFLKLIILFLLADMSKYEVKGNRGILKVKL